MLSIYRSIYLSVYQPIYLSINLSIYLSTYGTIKLLIYRCIDLSIDLLSHGDRSINLASYPSIYRCTYLELSFYLSNFRSVYASVLVSIHLSICLSIYLPICLSIHLSTCRSIYRCSRFSGRQAPPHPQWYPHPPPTPHASKVPTVTGIELLGVAILVTVVVFDASKPPSSQLSSVFPARTFVTSRKY